MKVVCAMSGGVDSSVAAALLRDAGHEVIGMTMRLTGCSEGATGRPCGPSLAVERARQVCEKLRISHYEADEREAFASAVIDPFVRDYASGRTPNPCARCNQRVKFGSLLRRAKALGAAALATGHYARIRAGRLARGADRDKDQSYFLFGIGTDALSRALFPLGDWHKQRTRAHAQSLGLCCWDSPGSQEMCFVSNGDHAGLVEQRAAALGIDPEALAPGKIVSESGEVLGEHRGIHRVTVGQRRGLQVAGTQRLYVLRIDPARREVVVGDAEALGVRSLEVVELERLDMAPAGTLRAEVQIRYRSRAQPATVRWEGDCATVTFDAPVVAAAPGQAAVFYDQDRVLGGGWIHRTVR